ncbi:MAG: hypothetical protein D6806_05980 [Deltaproteobacteria bacterium]|nr:MAG: hypothetical protein D6806_05980 [Deltaproteobacteria bacterium]
MRFRELVLQGVRHFQQTFRLTLPDGFTVFVGPTGSGKSTIVDVVYHILNPDPTEPGTSRFTGTDPNLCRAAFTIEAADGKLYRLVQDLVRGSLVLAGFDPRSRQFVKISDSTQEIRQYLGAQLHLPHADVLSIVHFPRAGQLPSLAPLPAASSPAVDTATTATALGRQAMPDYGGQQDAATQFPGYQGAEPYDDRDLVLPDDPEEMKQQLETLKRDLEIARRVDEAQFELDGLQSELFELEQKGKEVEKARQKLEQLDRQLEQFAALERLPPDFEQKVKQFQAAKLRLEKDTGRLEKERESWQERQDRGRPLPLLRNRTFLLGMAGGAAALAAGSAGFFLMEWMRWLALLDIPAFGVALYAALRHIDAMEGFKHAQGRIEAIEQRLEKVRREFDLETMVVRKTMAEFEVDRPEKILEQFARRKSIEEERNEARQRLERLENDPDYQQNRQRQEQLKARMAELEKELQAGAGLMMGQREMERRIKALEKKLSALGNPSGASGQQESVFASAPPIVAGAQMAPPAPAGAPPGALRKTPAESPRLQPSTALQVDSSPAATKGPHQKLVDAGADLLLVPRERLETMLAQRGSQLLQFLSGGRYGSVSFGAGEQILCTDAHGQAGPVESLPGPEQDIVYLALWAAIVEAAGHMQPVPVLLDDSFSMVPAAVARPLGQLLAQLGSTTQVVLFTADEGWASAAGQSFRLA